jgi:glycosyltransferase involved in cell wall biosynthesis
MGIKILFVGTYLSKKRGSLCVSEKLANNLSLEGYSVLLTSRFENKILRFTDIIYTLFFKSYDLLHIEVYSGQAFIIAEVSSFIGYLFNKRIILTLHGGALSQFYLNNEKRIEKVFKRGSIITSPSQMLIDFFKKNNFEVKYVPNSIDFNNFIFNRSNIKPLSILWVRAFDSIYNPILAVDIFQRIHEVYPSSTFTMIGPDKGILSLVIDKITDLNLSESIYIKGSMPNNELYKYYQSHSIFLNTTSYESFGVAVLEAAACGIPIVSSNVGELSYLWKNKFEVMLVDELNIDSFVKAISILFDDKDLYDKLSFNAHVRATYFSWSNIKPLWLNILKSLND